MNVLNAIRYFRWVRKFLFEGVDSLQILFLIIIFQARSEQIAEGEHDLKNSFVKLGLVDTLQNLTHQKVFKIGVLPLFEIDQQNTVIEPNWTVAQMHILIGNQTRPFENVLLDLLVMGVHELRTVYATEQVAEYSEWGQLDWHVLTHIQYWYENIVEAWIGVQKVRVKVLVSQQTSQQVVENEFVIYEKQKFLTIGIGLMIK